MARVLIQTFATQGYLPWLELLLESLRVHSGERLDVRADTLNLSREEVDRIESKYTNVELRNEHLSDAAIAGELGISGEELAAWKGEIEDGRVSERNFLYKVYISVNRRYRALDKVIAEAKQGGYDVLVHTDSDLYVRSDLSASALIESAQQHDVSFYVNENSLLHTRKVLGAFLCFNLNGNIDDFVRVWMGEIDRVPFFDRWKGFGQSVLWYAMNSVDDVDVFDLNRIRDSFRHSRHFEPEGDMWFGSNSKLKLMKLQKKLGLLKLLGRAESSRARCWDDLERTKAAR